MLANQSRTIIATLLLIVGLSAATAYGQPTVMTFDSLAWSSGTGAYLFPDGYKYSTSPYTEAGFTITPSLVLAFALSTACANADDGTAQIQAVISAGDLSFALRIKASAPNIQTVSKDLKIELPGLAPL